LFKHSGSHLWDNQRLFLRLTPYGLRRTSICQCEDNGKWQKGQVEKLNLMKGNDVEAQVYGGVENPRYPKK